MNPEENYKLAQNSALCALAFSFLYSIIQVGYYARTMKELNGEPVIVAVRMAERFMNSWEEFGVISRFQTPGLYWGARDFIAQHQPLPASNEVRAIGSLEQVVNPADPSQ